MINSLLVVGMLSLAGSHSSVDSGRNWRGYVKKAAELWESFTENERDMVFFGIFPAEKMAAAEREGYATHPLVVALMVHGRTLRARGHSLN